MTIDDPVTTPLPVPPAAPRPEPPRSGALGVVVRFASGSVAAALVVVAVVVVIAAVTRGDRPGPGIGMLTGHLATAVAAVTLQVVADRRRSTLPALLVPPLAAVTLWFWWWG